MPDPVSTPPSLTKLEMSNIPPKVVSIGRILVASLVVFLLVCLIVAILLLASHFGVGMI